MPTPPGPYPSKVTSSYCSPSSWPVPRKMARSMLSFGIFSFLPARMAVRRRGLEFGSPPPMRAAMVISRISRVKTRPRLASVAAFLCLIVAHFECPDMTIPLLYVEFPAATRKPWPLPDHFGDPMGGLPLNYLRKIRVSRKLAGPLGPGRMRTSGSLSQASGCWNRVEKRNREEAAAAILCGMVSPVDIRGDAFRACAHD